MSAKLIKGFWDGQVMAVVTPESFPDHLRGVFLTRSAERAEHRAKQIGGMVFRIVDMDRMAGDKPVVEE